MTKLHLVNRTALALRADLFLAGVHCSLATNSEDILASVSRWTCTGSPQPTTALEIDILQDSSLPEDRGTDKQIHFRGLHHLVFATIGSHEVFTFDLLRRRVVGVVSSESASDSLFWNTSWLPITVGVMGITVGVVPLHSACLDLGGKGLLIAGESGAGKSTLAVALAQQGLALISDDWTYVSQGGSELIAYGLSVPVKLLPDAGLHFPELKSLTPKQSLNGELAFEVAAETIWPIETKTKARPEWLMLLERRSAPGCDFEPYDPVEVQRFFERTAERLPEIVPEAAGVRSAIIRAIANCQCWRVRSGESPQNTAEAITQFCERN